MVSHLVALKKDTRDVASRRKLSYGMQAGYAVELLTFVAFAASASRRIRRPCKTPRKSGFHFSNMRHWL